MAKKKISRKGYKRADGTTVRPHETTIDTGPSSSDVMAADGAGAAASNPFVDTKRRGPVSDADHAVLDAEWNEAFAALKEAGVEHDADDPVAVRYREASDAVNHANRSRDFYIATGQLPIDGSEHAPDEDINCKRCGGHWGDDVMCLRCTNAVGEPRDPAHPGPMPEDE